MRVIAGQWRNRKIDWPDSGNTRPITDRVKESLFDLLGTRYGTPGELPPLRVADVFCGGGSLGLEALSRGAHCACFFDCDVSALKVLTSNFKKLGVGPQASAVRANLWRTGVRPPMGFAPLELVFLDPPFPDTTELTNSSKTGSLLRRLGAGELVTEKSLIVFRHEKHLVLPRPIGKHWVLDDQRVYGRSILSLLRPFRPPKEESSDGPVHQMENQNGNSPCG